MINSKIKNLLATSWKIYSENFTYILGIYLLVTVIGGICNYIVNESNSMSSIQNLIFYFSSELFIIGLSLGLIKILLLINKNQPSTIGTLFSSFDLVFRSFNASILFTVMIFFTILPGLLIILMSCDIDSLFSNILTLLDFSSPMPTLNFNSDIFDINIHNEPLFILGVAVSMINIIWCAIRFQFYQYYIVDDECGIIQSFKRSFTMTANHMNILVQFILCLVFINLLGLLFFGVGIIFTIPFSLLAMTKLYLSLKRQAI